MMHRRRFLIGFGAAIAAPAIIKVESLMKLYVPKQKILLSSSMNIWEDYNNWHRSMIYNGFVSLMSDPTELLFTMNSRYGFKSVDRFIEIVSGLDTYANDGLQLANAWQKFHQYTDTEYLEQI